LFSSLRIRAGQAFRSLLLVMASVALVGCATPTASGVSSERPSQQFTQGQGGVAFRLTVSGVGISPFFAFWHQTVLTQVEGTKKGEKFVVPMSDLGAAGSATYFGALPEGRYEISSFSSEQCGYLCISASLKTTAKPIRFDVAAGRITYLGSLMYERTDDKSAQLMVSGTSPADQDNFRAWLGSYFPTIAAMPVADLGAGGEVRPVEFKGAQDRAAGLLNPAVLSNGDVLFTTLSGSLKRHSPSGGLVTVNTGSASRLNAVLALSDRHWVAAGDFGEARSTQDAGATWHDLKLNLPYGAIVGLYPAANGETIAVLDQKPTLALYTGSLATNTWTPRMRRDYKHDLWKGGISRPAIQFVASTGKLLVALPGGPSFVLDTKTMAASDFELPGGAMNVGLSGDDVLRCRCNKSGLWVSTWESRDLGKTWQDSPLDRSLPLPVFKDRRVGMNTALFDIQKTVDGGARWKTVLPQKAQYWPFLFLPYNLNFIYLQDRRVLATDSMYALLVSDDDGDTWKPARQSRP
jgi:photosystem II stability/assembly factor-like uncharacterized protein